MERTRECEKCGGWLKVKTSYRKASVQIQTMLCTTAGCEHTFQRAVPAADIPRRRRKLQRNPPTRIETER